MENSYYWSGTSIGDAGPYEDNTQWTMLGAIARSGNAESDSALYDIGVFYAVANKLEPTINGTNIDVDTGASFVDGSYHENDASVSVAIPNTGARTEYVVVRKNFSTTITYTPPSGVGPTVGPQESRITRVSVVVQDTTRATYWDVPLCSIDVDGAGALSNLVDLRKYVDVEDRSFFVQTTIGRDDTAGSDVSLITVNNEIAGIEMTAADDVYAFGHFSVSDNFVSDMTFIPVLIEASGGNTNSIVAFSEANWSTDAETYDNHTSGSLLDTKNMSGVNKTKHFLDEESISPTTNDTIAIYTWRNGNNLSDTFPVSVYFVGWIVKYKGF